MTDSNAATSNRAASTRVMAAMPFLGHALVVGAVVAMAVVSLNSRFLGPHLRADFSQARAALGGRFEPSSVLHYGHIWALRLSTMVVADRRLAAGLVAAISSSVIVLSTYGIGLRCTGRRWAIFAAAAALCFPPLSIHFSTPLAVSTAMAFGSLALWLSLAQLDTPRWAIARDGVVGLLFGEALACDVSLLALLPALMLTQAQHGRPKGQVYALFALGLLGSGVLLMLGHQMLHGNPLAFVQPAALDAAKAELSGYPWTEMWRKKSFHTPLLRPLLAAGTRETVLCGALGLALSLGQRGPARALLLWLAFQLPVTAWLFSRSAQGELIRGSLIALCPALALGAALLLARVSRSRGMTREEMPTWLVVLIGICACTIAMSGIQSELRILLWHSKGFATQRGAMFLFTVAVPICLSAAALLRAKQLRALPLALAASALLLCGQRPSASYYDKVQPEVNAWARFARGVAQLSPPRVAIFYPQAFRRHPFTAEEIQSRLATLSPHPIQRLLVRLLPRQEFADSNELLMIDFGNTDNIRRFSALRAPEGYAHLTRIDREGCVAQVFIPPDLLDAIPATMRQLGAIKKP